MADIKDVAAKAGVSIGTVSKVIRGYPSISLKTRENVKAAIKELDYVPNPIALSYASTKSKRVLVYISSLNSDIEDKEKIGSFLEGV
ncbi:MAG: LacI family DNA-binding transcriptional regulator, partial [Erysipelotrichaceae bacterium]|nr:LacI family DNA-binding transcriptional regulator [Erysipelotrichaceae bacterium]